MARLSMLKPGLKGLPSLAFMPKDEKERDRFRDKQPWRSWYKSQRWRALRMRVFLRDMFTCQMCGRLEGNTSVLVADHKKRHGGVEDRFFNEAGVWTICKPCHDGPKQSAERREAAARND